MFLAYHNTRSTNPAALLARARRIAKHEGFFVRKSRKACVPDIYDGYQICDALTGFPVFGHRYELDEASVLAWLTDDEGGDHE